MGCGLLILSAKRGHKGLVCIRLLGAVRLDVDTARSHLVAQLRALERTNPNFDGRSYLSSPVPVLGLSVPKLRSIGGAFWKAHRNLAAAEVNRLTDTLWSGATFEEKCLAVHLLMRYRKVLDEDSWHLVDSWVDGATGWGLCDSLASGPVAAMVYQRPARFRKILKWTRSKNIWRRRAAAYALRDFVRGSELDRPFELLERLLYDEEFWVQRAVGTWLRECWKVDRRRTEAFLRKHVRGLPKVVITVATERAPSTFREELRRRRETG